MALEAGISKRELLEDYFIDEIFDVLSFKLHKQKGCYVEQVSVDEFFG